MKYLDKELMMKDNDEAWLTQLFLRIEAGEFERKDSEFGR